MGDKVEDVVRYTKASGDILNHILGDFGMYQLRLVLIIFLYKIPAAWFMSCIIFTAPEMFPGEYKCVLGENERPSKDECWKYNNETMHWSRCEDWDFNYFVVTLNGEFDLVCQYEILVAMTQFWHLVGILFGGFFATLAMRSSYARPRRLLLIALFSQLFFGIGTGKTGSYKMHCVFRCISAACCSVMLMCGQVIFSNYTGGIKYRHGVVQLYDTYWSLGVMHIASSTRLPHWQYIYVFISLPTIFLIILTVIWVPEDIRWLLIHKKDAKHIAYVNETLINAAHLNDRMVFVPNNLIEELTRLSQVIQQPTANWFTLWGGPCNEIVQIIIGHIALSIFVVNFNGLLLNTRSFGRTYLQEYAILSAFSEILGCIISLFLSIKVNTIKWQIAAILNVITGIIGCLGWFVPETTKSLQKSVIYTFISCCEKLGTSVAQSMLLGCLSEIVDPRKKFILMFSAITCARICCLAAPFLNVLKIIHTAASLSTFSVMGILGGFIMFFINGLAKM